MTIQPERGDRGHAQRVNIGAALEQMLERGRADPGVIERIVNGTPLIRVEIHRGSGGPFIVATLIN